MTEPAITPAQTSGPLFGFALLRKSLLTSVAPEDPRAVVVTGVVTDASDVPLAWETLVEIWADGQFVRCRTERKGVFKVTLRKPEPIPLPDGSSLAPALNVRVFGRGLNKPITTRLYFPDETERNAHDPILLLVDAARRPLLIAEPDATGAALRFDVHLQGPSEIPIFQF